jgi:ABC-type transport system involved in multi-copper enzyme maturation permease subunit
MTKIAAIALNTFKEAIRNRILYILLFFAILILLGSWVVSTLAIFGQDKIIRDFGIMGINLISVAIAVLVGIGLVYNDLDKRTIYTIVSKPISRWQFLVGKYFGLLLTIFVNVLIMTFFFVGVLYFRDYTSEEALGALYEGTTPPSGVELSIYYLGSIFSSIGKSLLTVISFGIYHSEAAKGIVETSLLTMMEMSVITSFAVLFSSFSSPTLSAFMTIIVFMIGRANQDLYLFADLIVRRVGSVEELSGGQMITYWFSWAAAHLAPNLEVFNQREAVANFLPVEISAYSILYGFAYSVCVLLVATIIFNRRNFK